MASNRTTQRHPESVHDGHRNQAPGEEGDHGHRDEPDRLLHGEAESADSFGDEFGDVGIDGNQFAPEADARHQAPEVNPIGGGLECHDRGAEAVPDEGVGEDGAIVPVRKME